MQSKKFKQQLQWSAGLMISVAILITALVSALPFLSHAIKSKKQAFDDSLLLCTHISKEKVVEIAMELEGSLNIAKTLAKVISGVKEKQGGVYFTRDSVNSILRKTLESNPHFLGIYTCWEPNAFDKKDELFAGMEGHDNTGRFIPYWVRDKNGKIVLEPLVDYENVEKTESGSRKGDYYLLPREKKKPIIMDPDFYPVSGVQVYMVSILAPIMVDDVFYGIVGIDLSMDQIQTMTKELGSLYEGTSKGYLISNNGTLVAATDDPKLVGKHMRTIHEDWEADLAHIHKEKDVAEADEGRIATFIPMDVGNLGTPWAVNLLVPIDKISKNADQMLAEAKRNLLVIAVISFILIIGSNLMSKRLARKISAPILDVVSDLKQSSDQLDSASSQISSGSHDLAGTTSQQAAAIEEISSSLEELLSMTKRNSENALSAKDMSGKTRTRAEDGSKDMGTMVDAMSAIKSSSAEIANIIKTIDEIAFQTNILALNAAVEAARAGEAGAGFAVVAGEVRNLAQRAAMAARETAEKIEASITKSQHGGQICEKVSTIFKEILASTQTVDTTIAEISMASQEQTSGVDQIAMAIRQMESSTQSAAAGAEESASAAEELSRQASNLSAAIETLNSIFDDGSNTTAATATPITPVQTIPVRPAKSFATQSLPALPPVSQKKRQTSGFLPMKEPEDKPKTPPRSKRS